MDATRQERYIYHNWTRDTPKPTYGKKLTQKKQKNNKKKNLRFYVGFQPYTDHDIYRAIIFFWLHDICRKYFQFLSRWSIFPNGPYYPKFPYTGVGVVGVRILRKSWFWGQTKGC